MPIILIHTYYTLYVEDITVYIGHIHGYYSL